MYIPKHFAREELLELKNLISEHGFGTLITVVQENRLPIVSHIPILLSEVEGLITLEGHVARPNPQALHIIEGFQALAIFQGPHTYISPTWYRSPGVPTWNYVVVHVYGHLRSLTGDRARSVVERLSEKYEGNGPLAWKPEYPDKMLNAIQCFEMIDLDFHGKYKLNQNRSLVDQQSVVEALNNRPGADAQGVARLMSQNLEKDDD